ncbi:DUF523 domain-containing protein [Vulgatibacter sp.]|uniref:DUF523 domain-containing protein n=1 Tax=Vulgatibacter sp. TaxID=1971226 RepID=UPI003561C5F4
MEKVLVSACLLGERVRYDGRDKRSHDDILARWEREGRVVSFCPEIGGGLPVPRPPAEIRSGVGADVLAGRAAVRNNLGGDDTAAFRAGAERALQIAQRHGIRVAVLKERSPSCGSSQIYDGTFTGKAIAGEGVTTALLRQHGIAVFSEAELAEADAALRA